MPRSRPLILTAILVSTTALVAAAFGASAQTSPAQLSPVTSTTDGPTTTVSPSPTILPGTTTTTTAPPSGGGGSPSTSTTSTTVPTAADATPPPGQPDVIPPQFLPMINSVHRGPPNNTTALLAALKPLLDAGLTQDQAIAIGFGQFPVGGQASFSDDWWTPRFTPTFHLHQGNDIFAAGGTPVRAPVDGVLRQANEAVGGLSDYVTQPDGTFYYMAHLSAFVTGQSSGQKVKQGEVIGFVGNTGDAAGGATHCHFEIHPHGGAAVDPNATLDAWLAADLAAVPQLLATYAGDKPQSVLATTLTNQSASDGLFGAPTVPPRDQLLWASSASPGGALHLAEAAAANAASTVDWAAESAQQAAVAEDQARAQVVVRALMAPLTPEPLRPFLGI